MEKDQGVAGRTVFSNFEPVLMFYKPSGFHLTARLLVPFQLIFKRYAKDQICSISSFEMRNAVNDAGEQHDRNAFRNAHSLCAFQFPPIKYFYRDYYLNKIYALDTNLDNFLI